MNLSIVLIVLSLAFIAFVTHRTAKWIYKGFRDDIWLLLAFGASLFISILVSATVHNEYFDGYTKEKEYHWFYMHSLGNDKYTEGDFVLGTGSINEVDYYFFHGNTTKGMARIKVPVKDTYYIEYDGKPKITKVFRYVDDTDLFWKVWDNEGENSYGDPYYYKMYVPKGTLQRKFQIY